MRFLIVAIALIGMATVAVAEDGDGILGQWFSKKGDARFEFTKRDGKYHGHICWEKESVYDKKDKEAGRQTHDRNNPDPALRSRPMLGLELLKDFQYVGEKRYENGTIYNPEDGRTYKAKLTLADPEHLHVRGFIGISLLGGTTVWTRKAPPSSADPDDAESTSANRKSKER
ncbi:MAG: DUF2147 domain-containing protein [Candidatus Hydrogenedentes bacterium]|nr:DUF2147 domain-containing protein [Candidatus Hydrogenedentota bacterium]